MLTKSLLMVSNNYRIYSNKSETEYLMVMSSVHIIVISRLKCNNQEPDYGNILMSKSYPNCLVTMVTWIRI